MTVPAVEILWPSSLPSDPAEEGQELLREAGVETRCMLLPTRRGAAEVVMVLVMTAVLDPFLRTLFQKVAEDAHKGLKAFTDRLFASSGHEAPAPEGVVFETPAGGRVTFTPGLPPGAYQQAVGLDVRDQRWTWDSRAAMWVPN
ncbi:hypothetical protein ACFV20_16675 [Streptomyces sp. NPDC059696]|uniref:hypothetical protein n=1 Tax=Streptomyces sp. NPDC059696 TaxID=3346911 RepID=UPI0036C308CB